MQYWRDLDSKRKIVDKIEKRFKTHLRIQKLLSKKRDTLFKYVETKVESENKIGGRSRMVKVGM